MTVVVTVIFTGCDGGAAHDDDHDDDDGDDDENDDDDDDKFEADWVRDTLRNCTWIVVLPAGHAEQFVIPALGWYLPAAHCTHPIVDEFLNCPDAHAVHEPDPLELEEPKGQSVQSIIAALGWYLPAAHCTHSVVDEFLYCPAAHAVHKLDPLELVKPKEQAEQGVVGVGLNCPAAHIMQLLA
jgi:hypothetical protein